MTSWADVDKQHWLSADEVLVRHSNGAILTKGMLSFLGAMILLAVAFDLISLHVPRLFGEGTFVTILMGLYALGFFLADTIWRREYAVTNHRLLCWSGWRLGKPSLRYLPLSGMSATTGIGAQLFITASQGEKMTFRFLGWKCAMEFANEINIRGQAEPATRSVPK